jgi:hypothetical protein
MGEAAGLLVIFDVLHLGAIAIGNRWERLAAVGKGWYASQDDLAGAIRVCSAAGAVLIGSGW